MFNRVEVWKPRQLVGDNKQPFKELWRKIPGLARISNYFGYTEYFTDRLGGKGSEAA